MAVTCTGLSEISSRVRIRERVHSKNTGNTGKSTDSEFSIHLFMDYLFIFNRFYFSDNYW